MLRVRNEHEELVLRLLRRHGPLSRGELVALSGLSRTTLYDIVVALVDGGTVTVSVPEVARRGRGRPVEKLALNPAAGQVIGIDFARQAVRVATASITHEVIATAGERQGATATWQERVDTAYRLVGRLTGGAPRLGALSAIGVGVSAPLAATAAELPDGDGPGAVAELVRRRFDAPVRWDNGSRLAALAESRWGAARGDRDVVYLHLSHGVGGGLVVDGTLHRGAYGLSGEFGHITVDPEGAACCCGGVGCLQTVASVGAVLDAYRTAGGAARDLGDLVAALASGDCTARAVLAGVGTRIGRVLAALSHTVDPRVIVVGGELAAVGEAVLEPIRRALDLGLLPDARAQVSLRPARFGEFGAALGAVAWLRPGTTRVPRLDAPTADHAGRRGAVAPLRSDAVSGDVLLDVPAP
ncbi:ROK family protein [Streptomyces sp. NPDC098781]|uniref:ROK family transcriptional regulator n=1 Tax=Streptomyces sp. NPDC098781 TaxID=3366097 RepID=UPI0037FF55D5